MSELSEEVRRFAYGSTGLYGTEAQKIAEKISVLEIERAAWKEAFIATRAYYSNNNGENSKRYREAMARLKEMRLIK